MEKNIFQSSLKMEDKRIVEMIESVERLGNWAGEKIVELRVVSF